MLKCLEQLVGIDKDLMRSKAYTHAVGDTRVLAHRIFQIIWAMSFHAKQQPIPQGGADDEKMWC